MNTSARAPLYDLFKLVVAIILLLVFLLLLFFNRPSEARQIQVVNSTMTPLPFTPSTTLRASPTVVPASLTPIPPTAIPSSTEAPTLTATVIPAVTESPASENLPTPIVEIPSDKNACEAVSHSQLQVGMKASITHTVNFRSSPGVLNNWILTNQPGIQVKVVGGPACTRYENGGAYLWWQIKLPNGLTGWSAEASAFGKFYFMEPVK
jgi:hypothetical protein